MSSDCIILSCSNSTVIVAFKKKLLPMVLHESQKYYIYAILSTPTMHGNHMHANTCIAFMILYFYMSFIDAN